MSLIACSTRQVVRTEYIRQQIPELPQEPEYYSVVWHILYGKQKAYCIDEKNAKNLLKNRMLEKAYLEEMKEILKNLKGQ